MPRQSKRALITQHLKSFQNGDVLDSQSFTDLASANSFFTENVLNFELGSGVTDIGLVLDTTMSGGEGFGFDYTIAA